MPTKFNISGRHVEVTPALDTYARSKLGKIENIFHKVTTVHVTLSVEKKLQKAEAEVKLAGDQNSIFAESATEDMYKSIDELEGKLLRQVKKYHDKLTDHHKGESFSLNAGHTLAPPPK
jgi:putative sigma-54 modulation protein